MGWGQQAKVIGQKASRHYHQAQVIGGKVSTGLHHAQGLYNEARNVDSLQGAMRLGRREAARKDEYRREVNKVYRDTDRLGRNLRNLGRDATNFRF